MNTKIIFLISVMILFISACTKKIEYNKDEIPSNFVGLPAFPADSGFQLHIPAFPIPANFEREVYIRKDFNNTTDIYVNKFRSIGRSGTHHFVLNTIREDVNFPLPPVDVMVDQNNMDGNFNLFSAIHRNATVMIAQSDDYTLELPKGYALRLNPYTKWMANPHYFNKTDKVRFGEIYCNIYTVKKEDVQFILENTIIDGTANLVLPPNQETTITTDFICDVKTEFMQMSPHYHKRGKKFQVQIIGGLKNGDIILESYDYQNPVALNFFNQPLILNKGEGLRTIATYYNESSKVVKYGVTSEDEMNYLFMYSRSL